MKCPFCHEVIKRYTRICPICGERVPQIYSTIDFMLPKLKIFFICIVGLIIIACCGYNYNKYVNDSTYKSIQVQDNQTEYYTYPSTAYDVTQKVIGQDKDVYTLLTSKAPQKKKDKVFKTYLDNIVFFEQVLAYKITQGDFKGITFDDNVNIVSPSLPMYKYEWWDENAELAIRINKKYLESKYSKYFPPTNWNEYMKAINDW